MNLMKTGTEWLIDQLRQHASECVIYRFIDGATVTATAILGATSYEVSDEFGTLIGAKMIDFLIPASDLTKNPSVGDRITINNDVYEVLELGNEGCWRWSDPFKTIRRIHTKAV